MFMLTKEFMSSEESAKEDLGTTDNAGSSRHSVLAIKPLSWRAPKVDRFFKRLDHKAIARGRASKASDKCFHASEADDHPERVHHICLISLVLLHHK